MKSPSFSEVVLPSPLEHQQIDLYVPLGEREQVQRALEWTPYSLVTFE